MSTPGYHIPNAQPLGTPNPVMPTQAGQRMLPGASTTQPMMPPQGPAYVQGQPMLNQSPTDAPFDPLAPTNSNLSRPEILQQIIDQQNQAADPQAMAEQANNMRIEQLLTEHNNRASQQSDQMSQALNALSQNAQQQADFQRQQLEIQRQQYQAQEQQRLAEQQQPWEHPSLQLAPDVEQTFEDALPVMDTVSRRNALRTAHEVMNNQLTPQLQAMQQQIEALSGRVQTNTQLQSQNFAAGLQDIGAELSLDLDKLDMDPAFVEYKRKTSNEYTGATIDADLQSALRSMQMTDLPVIRKILTNFVRGQEATQQSTDSIEVPPQSGQARTHVDQQMAAPAGAQDQFAQAQQQIQQLENYRTSLMDKLRRGQMPVGEFEQAIAEVEQGVDALIVQQQVQT